MTEKLFTVPASVFKDLETALAKYAALQKQQDKLNELRRKALDLKEDILKRYEQALVIREQALSEKEGNKIH
mgnify:CR=1 FL=1